MTQDTAAVKTAGGEQAAGREALVQRVADGIWRIETGYQSPATAACYLVEGGGEYALVDCGTGLSAPVILAALEAIGVAREAVTYLLPTHVHLDHAGGAGALMRACPAARLLVHPRGLRHLIDPTRLVQGAQAVYGPEAFAAANGDILPVPAARASAIEDGAHIDLGARRLVFVHAPGHARHHLVIWDEASQGFFTGDVFGLSYPALEIAGRPFMVPTTTPVQFDPPAWEQTFDRLLAYAPQRMYLTHFGCVEQPQDLAPDLRRRIKAHAALAREHPALDESALALRLARGLFADYCESGGDLTRAEFLDVLNVDLRLNAQGLRHWVASR